MVSSASLPFDHLFAASHRVKPGVFGVLKVHGTPDCLAFEVRRQLYPNYTLNLGPKLGQLGCLMPFSESAFNAQSFGVSHIPIPQLHVGAEGHGPHLGVGQLRGYHSYRFLSYIKVVLNEVLSPNYAKDPNSYPESGSKIGSIGLPNAIF